jgi:hypothetical protein
VYQIVAASAVAYGAPHCQRALERFALSANGRLRLTRVSVSAGGASLVRITWEACLVPELQAEIVLPLLVRAVACAHASTSSGLTALGDPRVARGYLDLGW